MIDTFAWTANLTRHGGTELALIAASPTAVLDPVAESVPAHPIPAETRHRVRAGLANSDAEYPGEAFRVYRLGGYRDGPHHDLAVAVAVHQLAAGSPWRGLLDHIVFLAEIGLDGSLRPSHPPQALTTIAAAAARAEFRYIVIATPEHTDDLNRIEGITVLTPTDLRGVLTWLESLAGDHPAPTSASPDSPGMRIAHNLGPGRVRHLRAVLDGSGSNDPPATGCRHPDQDGPPIAEDNR
ncbi:magnesium chelatase domain-containing protein [Nocardia pseudovaccinii]|uniref:magnesium chelatase domain-containing protein n=1 Tax=Nocardia pseudovaccinii TaxID=189540 RepID=UPI0007A3B297|nr:magnesium chelatase domain-containing protein [Nocardia pseudovaccinii]